MVDNELDMRRLPKTDEHPIAFATYADLPVGGSFVLVSNHDPQCLHEEFEADYAGSYQWEYVQKGPTDWRIRISKLATSPLPTALTNTAEIGDRSVASAIVDRVTRKPDAREGNLDWKVISLAPGGETDTAAGTVADVLIHVISGSGRLTTEERTIELAPGALFWLPRQSRPLFTAGSAGLRYLTVNQKWEIRPP
ncbi:hypothetical protein MULP_01044 [Mycobacterium liflandii 128FXT]|uniref:DUF2249 domain-containing protein n=1 Tax=Mycobacterium liflandii (strain 128FXT) TaxID=459424 RepID=L7V6K7_MYCL1|nr:MULTISPECIES: DUF2249 domain-containing protein [Mycobacterium ulcerans group]AGC61064.1 hypothetical protein MULP_01044 [Mycobacterium liflandii 128FXT]